MCSNRIRVSLASLARRSIRCSPRRTSLRICTMSQAMPNRQHGSCRYQLSTLKDSRVRFQPSHRHPSRRHPSRGRASRGRSHRRTILAVAPTTILAIQALTIIRANADADCNRNRSRNRDGNR